MFPRRRSAHPPVSQVPSARMASDQSRAGNSHRRRRSGNPRYAENAFREPRLSRLRRPRRPASPGGALERNISLDLIVADYNLPGPNGLEVVAKIGNASGRKIPAILLTGDISATTLREIAEHDHVHLYKPVNARSLMRHVNYILDKGNQRSTVFVVDDDREIREALRETLEKRGYRAESFADGSAFLDAYSPDRAGCVITDACMPGIGGLQLIKQVPTKEYDRLFP